MSSPCSAAGAQPLLMAPLSSERTILNRIPCRRRVPSLVVFGRWLRDISPSLARSCLPQVERPGFYSAVSPEGHP